MGNKNTIFLRRKLTGPLGGTWLSDNAILWDSFLTPDAAPVTSPRTAEPGPGLSDIVDTENKLSISNGALACSSGKTVPAVGDPGANLGSDNAGSTAAQAMQAGYAAFYDMTPAVTNKSAYFGLDANIVGTPKPTFNFLGANLRVLDSAGNAVATFTNGYSAAKAKWLLAQRSSTHGYHFIRDGKLLWPDDSARTSSVYVRLANLDQTLTVADIALLPLADYNSAWGGDWSEVTDTEVNQASKDYDCEANCHVTGSFTCENTKFIYIYIRYTDGDNWVRLSIGTDRVVKLEKNVATSTTTVATGSTLTDAVEYQYDIVANGPAVEGFINCISDVSGAITDHATVAQGRLEHDLASNDLDVTSHPTPALGIADSRIICPQADDTWTHSDDLVAEIKNITLPSAANMNFFFRTTPVLVCYADGSAILWEAGNQRISTGAGTVSDGDDIVLVFEGVNAQVFVNGSSIGTTSALVTLSGSGRLEFAGVTDGTADHIACFPRDLTSLLPPDVR